MLQIVLFHSSFDREHNIGEEVKLIAYALRIPISDCNLLMYYGWTLHRGGGGGEGGVHQGKSTVLEGCTARTKHATIYWKDWHWQRVIAEDSTFWSCTHPQTVQTHTANGRLTSSAILLRGFTSFPVFCCLFVCLAQLYKEIEIHTSEGSRQQVLLLQLSRTPFLPGTPLQWGGNWTDHTLFTHFTAKMKWVVPKHTVTDRGGRRSLFHQRHIF